MAKHANEKQAWQKPQNRERKSSFRENRKHGDCFLCLLFQKWKQKVQEKAAEQGIEELAFQVVFF